MPDKPPLRVLPLPLAAAALSTLLAAAALRLWQLPLLPPGLYFDEAFNGLDAGRVLTGVQWPLFFAGNGGREPLFIYLGAAAVALLGPTPLALRLVSAFAGIVTVGFIFATGRWLYGEVGAQGSSRSIVAWAALVAAAGLAVSFWHVILSRIGFRAVLLPPTSMLAIGFFWRAWTQGRLRDFVMSGVWLALALHTYLAARVLPGVILLFVGVEFLVDMIRTRNGASIRALWKVRLRGLLALGLVALLMLTPLLLTFLHDPSLLSTRVGDLSIFAADRHGSTLLQQGASNLWAAVRGLYIEGDGNLRHNLPGRPANDWLQAALLSLGLLTACVQIRRSRSRLLLIWLGVMALPAVLTTTPVHALRNVGLLPPLALLYGLGALGIAALASRLLKSRQPQDRVAIRILATIWALVLVVSGWQTARDYFQRWAHMPALAGYFQVDQQLAATAAAARLRAPDAAPLLISRHLFLQAQTGFALGPIYLTDALPPGLADDGLPRSALKAIVEPQHVPNEPMFLLWRDAGRTYATQVEPPSAPDGRSALSATGAETLRSPLDVPEWPTIQVVTLRDDATLTPRRVRYPLDVRFANGNRLGGYDVEPDAAGPQTGSDAFSLHLFFDYSGRASAPAGVEPTQLNQFDVFAHLRQGDAVVQTANGPVVGEHLPYWLLPDPAGDNLLFEDIRRVALSDGITPGKAFFETGLYTYHPAQTNTSFERIDILDGNGTVAADAVTLGGVFVGPPPAPVDDGLQPVGARFGESLELAGWCAEKTPGHLVARMAWRALDRPAQDYTAFVHMVDSQGAMVAQYDAPPGSASNPTHQWAPGEMVLSEVDLDVKGNALPESAQLQIGLYEPTSGNRLPLNTVDGSSPGDDFVSLSPADAPCP